MSEYLEKLVDEDSLGAYLTDALGPEDRFDVTYHQEGHSNETLFVTWGDRELVLRRPPAGETADTAHDVLREYRIYVKLQDTEVPVPNVVLACEDHDVLGCDFYLMDRLEGDVVREDEPPRFADPDSRRRMSERFVDTVATIHTLNYDTVSLGDLGNPEGFTKRQVERWSKQFEWAAETTEEYRTVPDLHTIDEWLHDNLPTDCEHTLVHGDLTLDNVMFAPGRPPRINGVLDWEMGTLGDPFVDLGWTFTVWRDEKDPDTRTPDLTPTLTERDGYFTRQEFVTRYERRTGFTFRNERFYRALGLFKLAAVSEMFYARYLNGNSNDPLYPKMEEQVPYLAERALRIIEGEEPL